MDNGAKLTVPKRAGGRAADVQHRHVSLSDLNDTRILFGQLEEQVRIASAKLDGDTLGRKRKMGALSALLTATDHQINVLSAEIQRMEDRQRQIRQDLSGLEPGSGAQASSQRVQQLISQSLAPIQAAKARLEHLTRLRSQLQAQLSQLRSEHIHRLLEAAITHEGPDGGASNVLLEMLGEQLEVPE
jgi:chromosome segregation ATPase